MKKNSGLFGKNLVLFGKKVKRKEKKRKGCEEEEEEEVKTVGGQERRTANQIWLHEAEAELPVLFLLQIGRAHV